VLLLVRCEVVFTCSIVHDTSSTISSILTELPKWSAWKRMDRLSTRLSLRSSSSSYPARALLRAKDLKPLFGGIRGMGGSAAVATDARKVPDHCTWIQGPKQHRGPSADCTSGIALINGHPILASLSLNSPRQRILTCTQPCHVRFLAENLLSNAWDVFASPQVVC
jgi:hypothetical protein